MTHGTFIWTDLSTYDMAAARSDYAQLFRWRFVGDEVYDFAMSGGRPVAAVFPMPDRLAQMDMPSFWMSYVRVDDLEQSVAQARKHENVIMEVPPQPFGEDAQVALVRDPSGAGLTMYEGPDIAPPQGRIGEVVARYHHLQDVTEIEAFYSDLFGWTFVHVKDDPWPVWDIRHADGTTVAQAEEVPEIIRGTFRYWMPCFRGDAGRVDAIGGEVLTDLDDGRQMVRDRQGAHFMLRL
jgi:predicted enzyme related to lactoylglutathione lyase